jgi:hypothetical protein
MILSGEKIEEYREIKPYWKKRLTQMCPRCDGWCNDGSCECGGYYDYDSQQWHYGFVSKKFEQIIFSNGYSKDRPQLEIECLGIYIGKGKTEWGAIEDNEYFVIKLGKIKSKLNC